MLDECLRIFKQELKDNTNLVLNTIILADGDYVLVHSDGTYDVEKIKYSKKDHCLIEKPEDEIYDKLCFYDYQSQLVSMNKPQDPGKTIHSNNYLSLFVKKESFNNDFEKEIYPGVILGQKHIPVSSCLAYVPGGGY